MSKIATICGLIAALALTGACGATPNTPPTPMPTSTAVPTSTPIPTSTPAPTATPIPTATPFPFTTPPIDIDEIAACIRAMPDAPPKDISKWNAVNRLAHSEIMALAISELADTPGVLEDGLLTSLASGELRPGQAHMMRFIACPREETIEHDIIAIAACIRALPDAPVKDMSNRHPLEQDLYRLAQELSQSELANEQGGLEAMILSDERLTQDVLYGMRYVVCPEAQ